MANSTPPLNDQFPIDTRDFRISAISVITVNGLSKEISPLVLELKVRQDLFLGFMSGELVLTDGIDLHHDMSFHGGEFLYLHLTSPQQKLEIKKAFRIYKIGNRHPFLESSQRYEIYFMSNELFESYQKKVFRAYIDTSLSDMALDIMKKDLNIPESKIDIEKTDVSTDFISPGMRPFEAINWLASRSVSDNNNTFMFYENLEGFHFRSLQSMYKTNSIGPYRYENKKGKRDLDRDKFTIDTVDWKKDFDILSTISSGGYSMRLLSIDPLKRNYENLDYSLDKANKLYQNPVMSNVDGLFGKNDSHFLCYINQTGIKEWIKRTLHLSILNNSLIELVVPGNMELQIGNLVELHMPIMTTPADGDMLDKGRSGNYLIFAVNHKFDMINQKFTTLMMLTRDSSSESLPTPDNSVPDKINKLNYKS